MLRLSLNFRSVTSSDRLHATRVTLDIIPWMEYIPIRNRNALEWEILFDDDFGACLDGLDAALRNEILAHTALLRERGPHLGRPYVDTVEGSAFSNMKELRVQFRGDPWRILFAFDPNRAAILLVGGNKRGDHRWYKKHLAIADERFKRHLKSLEG